MEVGARSQWAMSGWVTDATQAGKGNKSLVLGPGFLFTRLLCQPSIQELDSKVENQLLMTYKIM